MVLSLLNIPVDSELDGTASLPGKVLSSQLGYGFRMGDF